METARNLGKDTSNEWKNESWYCYRISWRLPQDVTRDFTLLSNFSRLVLLDHDLQSREVKVLPGLQFTFHDVVAETTTMWSRHPFAALKSPSTICVLSAMLGRPKANADSKSKRAAFSQANSSAASDWCYGSQTDQRSTLNLCLAGKLMIFVYPA